MKKSAKHSGQSEIPWILSRKLAGEECFPQQTEIFEAWLAESEDNRKLWAKMQSGESLANYAGLLCKVDIKGGIDNVDKKIDRLRKRRLCVWIGSAATAAAAILLILVPGKGLSGEHMLIEEAQTGKILLSVGEQRVELDVNDDELAWREHVSQVAVNGDGDGFVAEPTLIRIKIPRGLDYKLRLPDSTLVCLNAETVLEYPDRFAPDQRSVSLSGEAFFDVSCDPGRPFRVTTGEGINVEVLGTKFNLNDYAAGTAVTLVEGAVAVSNESERVVLRPNQQAVVDGSYGKVSVSEVFDMKAVTAWTEGQFYYRSAPLATIIRALERWYGVIIVSEEDTAGKPGDITLMFCRTDTLETVLESLNKLTGVHFTWHPE